MVGSARRDSAARCVFLSELAGGEKAERLEKVTPLVALRAIPNGKGAEHIFYISTRGPSP